MNGLNYSITNYHTELVIYFIVKFGNGLNDNSPEYRDIKYFANFNSFNNIYQILSIDPKKYSKVIFSEVIHSLFYFIGK